MIGILLSNLGTPKSPQTADVRRYLREFLSDPDVIDINKFSRWFLVNLIIAPFRAPKSTKAYQSIWMKEGSPLLVYSQRLTKALSESLEANYIVKLGMRYGEPSLKTALQEFKQQGIDELRVLPLYPQYATSTTGSTEKAVLSLCKTLKMPEPRFIPSFFDHPDYIESIVKSAQENLKTFKPDFVLFSYHGLPERQILKTDLSGQYCLKSPDCCDRLIAANGLCYRAHCAATTRAVAEGLELKKENYLMSFQSRLGRTPWIQPFTDLVLSQLAKEGKKRLAVFCLSFVADCLETLEEIGIRAREQWRAEGGEELLLIPALNDNSIWVETLQKMLTKGD
ncbi:MAG: ferrochelatase [Deltaproteobacteria bacterium]|nr:ferrochelatase [Deltaproteobacteria bacterium]